MKILLRGEQGRETDIIRIAAGKHEAQYPFHRSEYMRESIGIILKSSMYLK